MANIRYLKGDATAPQGEGGKLLVHSCNDIGSWGRGFVLALSKRWPRPEQEYRRWFKEKTIENTDDLEVTGKFALGEVLFVNVEPNIWVANIIGQHDIGTQAGRPPVRYDAIRQGLLHCSHFCTRLGYSAHMPRLGAGLGGASWPAIETQIKDCLANKGVECFVYDL
jgi:O-acetyl-ADP-ribose deacetylase (regulator of RNase III)